MTTEELKAEALRVKNAIAEFFEAPNAMKPVIEKLKAYQQENRRPTLLYELTYLNGPAGRSRNEVLVMYGGNYVEVYEAMEQLIQVFDQLCDEIQLIPEEVDPIS